MAQQIASEDDELRFGRWRNHHWMDIPLDYRLWAIKSGAVKVTPSIQRIIDEEQNSKQINSTR